MCPSTRMTGRLAPMQILHEKKRPPQMLTQLIQHGVFGQLQSSVRSAVSPMPYANYHINKVEKGQVVKFLRGVEVPSRATFRATILYKCGETLMRPKAHDHLIVLRSGLFSATCASLQGPQREAINMLVIDKLLQPIIPRLVCTVVQCPLVNHPLMFNVAGHMYIYTTPHYIEPPHPTFMATRVTPLIES